MCPIRLCTTLSVVVVLGFGQALPRPQVPKQQGTPTKPTANSPNAQAAPTKPQAAQAKSPYDGLWIGRTSADQDIWLLVKGGSLKWLRTVLTLPPECAWGLSTKEKKPVVKLRRLGISDGSQGGIRNGALEIETQRSWEPFVEQKVMLKARFGPGTESSGELNSTANGGTQIPACKATEALNWTARRATQADIASSTLSLEERREAGERDPKPPANDGVWIGQTPAGVVVRFLLLDNTLAWLRTDLSLPDQCELGPKDSRYRTRVRFAELTGGELKDGAFRAAGSPTESLLKVTGAVSGRLSGGQFDGRFEYAAKGDSAFLKNCDYKIASEWTAHKAAPEEAKPLLSVHERIALGENVPMIRKVEFGSVAGNECGKQPFVPAAKPYQYPSPAVHIAYRIEMNPEAAPLVNEVGTEIEPALGSETYRNYCTDMIIDGGRSVPGVITTILRRSDSAPLRPGVYKFKVKVNGETTAAYTESFTVK